MPTWLVGPSSPTGNNRRIELPGLDCWWLPILFNRVFVYPGELNVNRLKESLGRALSIWPIMAGRLFILDNDQYVIEMSDNPVPLTFIENTVLSKWPLDSNVLVHFIEDPLSPFIDDVSVKELGSSSNDEPLFRLKLTHLVQSNEWVLGVSASHIVGDGDSFSRFLNTISRFYQQMEPSELLPIFERRIWKKDRVSQSPLPMIRYLNDFRPTEEILKKIIEDRTIYDPVHIHFSGEQLKKLHMKIGTQALTMHDALIAYIILTLNTHCYPNDDQRHILHASTYMNIRRVSDSIAPAGLVGNAIIVISSDDFDDSLSFSNIAATIRRSIVRLRDPSFLELCIATADNLSRQILYVKKSPNVFFFTNDIIVNSTYRYDWSNLVDFGYTDKCRCYSLWGSRLHLRVFRLNPVYDGTQWTRDREGAEVAFLIESDMKEKFTKAVKQDINDNFDNLN